MVLFLLLTCGVMLLLLLFFAGGRDRGGGRWTWPGLGLYIQVASSTVLGRYTRAGAIFVRELDP